MLKKLFLLGLCFYLPLSFSYNEQELSHLFWNLEETRSKGISFECKVEKIVSFAFIFKGYKILIYAKGLNNENLGSFEFGQYKQFEEALKNVKSLNFWGYCVFNPPPLNE